ncbi:MAG TPA: hypothetical protein VJQ25_08350 [Nitrospira sp.]|jgi:hypothetical protein|nr:hypothetical protein [Nitrospira sp.]
MRAKTDPIRLEEFDPMVPIDVIRPVQQRNDQVREDVPPLPESEEVEETRPENGSDFPEAEEEATKTAHRPPETPKD